MNRLLKQGGLSCLQMGKCRRWGKAWQLLVCSASTIFRFHWFCDHFNTGKIIHTAKDTTLEEWAMENRAHQYPREFQSRYYTYTPPITWIQSCRSKRPVMQTFSVLPVVLFLKDCPDWFLKPNKKIISKAGREEVSLSRKCSQVTCSSIGVTA